jgi:hypothetical protein
MLGEPLAFVLRSARATLNAQFVAARRAYPSLTDSEFARFLEGTVDAVATTVHAQAPDRVAEVVLAAYELGLELAGKRLLGGGAIEAGWRALAATPLLAAEPRRVLAAASNALAQLATTPGAQPEVWIAELTALAPRCPDVATLLKLGQVLGWKAGLAHYRTSALAVADQLPEALAVAAVGGAGAWAPLRARLSADPWFVPTGAAARVRSVGAFRGFGGLFRAPPRVASSGSHLVVSSADDAWLLAVDAFGATLHRATPDERAARPTLALPAGVRWSGQKLTVGGRELAAPIAGELTSAAADDTTLVLTSSLTHSIAVVALTASS